MENTLEKSGKGQLNKERNSKNPNNNLKIVNKLDSEKVIVTKVRPKM